MPSRARSVSGGRSIPSWPQWSAVSELMPPECEIAAMPGFTGFLECAKSCDTSSSSS